MGIVVSESPVLSSDVLWRDIRGDGKLSESETRWWLGLQIARRIVLTVQARLFATPSRRTIVWLIGAKQPDDEEILSMFGRERESDLWGLQ